MSNRITIRAAAESDLAEIIGFIAMEDPAAAQRVRFATIETMRQLKTNPRLGRPYRAASEKLVGLRKLNVRDYPMYLIFYRLLEKDHVDILRVIDGRRDLEALLEED